MTKHLEEKIKELFKKKEYATILELHKKNQDQFNNNLFLIESVCLSSFNLSDHVTAKKFAEKILAIKSDHLGAHHILARVLANSDIDQSLSYYKKLLNLSKNSTMYQTEYASLLFSLGLFDTPISIFKKLSNENPDNLGFKITLARIFIENHDFDEAIEILNEILSKNKQLIKKYEILNLLATAYHNKGDYKNAKKYYNDCIELEPKFLQVYTNLAVLEQENNHFDDARKIIDKSNKIKKNAECYRLISAEKKFKDQNDIDILEMKGLESSASLDNKNRSIISFALGKAFEDLKDFPQSAEYYIKANKLRRNQFKSYNFLKELEIFKQMEEMYDDKFFDKNKNNGDLGEGLIFIVGMPRSGTTLLEQILSSHSNLYGAGELNYFTQAIDNFLQVLNFENFKSKISSFKIDDFLEIGKLYSSKIDKKIKNQTTKKFIIDKNPLNFRNIPLIFSSLPKAKVLHIKRNQNDNCFSIYKNSFYHNVMPWSYSQKELKDYYSHYNRFAKSISDCIPNFIYQVNYEDLTIGMEKEIKNVLNFLNLEWEPACLEFYNNKRSVRTASINQVRQKIYQTSNNKWENYKNYFIDLFI